VPESAAETATLNHASREPYELYLGLRSNLIVLIIQYGLKNEKQPSALKNQIVAINCNLTPVEESKARYGDA